MNTSATRLVARALSLEHLDHQPFAAILDALVEEDLDVLDVRRVVRSRECKLSFDGFERFVEQLPTPVKVLSQQRLWRGAPSASALVERMQGKIKVFVPCR